MAKSTTRKPKASKAAAVPASDMMTALGNVVAATNTGPQGFTYMAAFDYQPLVDAGYVEVNTAIVDAQGNHAVRATETGKFAVANAMTAPSDSPPVETVQEVQKMAKPVFEIDTDVSIPSIQRRSGDTIYPFAQLEIGQSFHIPATESDPEPWKTKGSAVSSATKRMQPKQFAIRHVGADDKRGEGARVWRKADMTAADIQALADKRAKRANKVAAE
jgi:hypothetical protein